MSVTVTLLDVKNDISRLLDRVMLDREEVIIAEDGTPVVRLVRIESPPVQARRGRRTPGSAIGQIVLSPDFDEPLASEHLDLFVS